MNQCTWLGLPWIPGPAVCLSLSLYHARTHMSEALKSGDVSFSEISSKILCCWGAISSCSCKARELSNTQRLCWPRPLANLGCRQHRVLADLNQSVKVSAPPSFAPHLFLLHGFFSLTPLPPCFSHLTSCLSFLLKGEVQIFFSKFVLMQYSHAHICIERIIFHCSYSVQSSAKANMKHQRSELDKSSGYVQMVF